GEGDPADADGRGVPEAGGETVLGRRFRVLPGGGSGLRPRRPVLGVDLDPVHVPEVDDDASVGGAVAGEAVAPAPHRQLQAVVGGELHRLGHVFGVGDPDHGGGAPVERVEDLAVGVVGGVVGAYYAPCDRAPQAAEVDHSVCHVSPPVAQ